MWDYTVVVQGKNYAGGEWAEGTEHIKDVAADTLGEAVGFLESVTPEMALEWERSSGCNGLDVSVFADEVDDNNVYTMEFVVVAESFWVGDKMVELSLMPWSPIKEELSESRELDGKGEDEPLEPWIPSGEKWDEATFCWKGQDALMVISAFPTANDGGGYSVNICEAKHGEPALSESGQYFGYESVADVIADYVGSGASVFKLLDYGFEFESYDDLCERAVEIAGIDIVRTIRCMGYQTSIVEDRSGKVHR